MGLSNKPGNHSSPGNDHRLGPDDIGVDLSDRSANLGDDVIDAEKNGTPPFHLCTRIIVTIAPPAIFRYDATCANAPAGLDERSVSWQDDRAVNAVVDNKFVHQLKQGAFRSCQACTMGNRHRFSARERRTQYKLA